MERQRLERRVGALRWWIRRLAVLQVAFCVIGAVGVTLIPAFANAGLLLLLFLAFTILDDRRMRRFP